MKKLIKNYGLIIVMIGIEAYFFYDIMISDGIDYELFFFSWAAIWFAIFFFSRRDSAGMGGGLDFRKSNDLTYSMTTNSKTFEAKNAKGNEKDKRSVISIEFMYLGMFLANVIAYIIYINIAF